MRQASQQIQGGNHHETTSIFVSRHTVLTFGVQQFSGTACHVNARVNEYNSTDIHAVATSNAYTCAHIDAQQECHGS
jgi:hypothetical protein